MINKALSQNHHHALLLVQLGLCLLTMKGKKWKIVNVQHVSECTSFLSDIQKDSEINSHCNEVNLKHYQVKITS